ncbi:MAG TPA: extracellular solute-binding protein [Solirubrobacteraceae bacterium]|jgi:iron(III) transport system substrate-binding protein
MSRGKPSLLMLLAAAGLTLSACGGAGGAALTVYSGQHEQTTALLVAQFEKQTGIKVSIRSGDEASLGNQVLLEGANSPADVFYSENTPVLEALRERGLLGTISQSTLAAVPARYDSAQGNWVGVSARASVLVYDTRALKPSQLPHSVLELAQPRWKGKVGFAPSETDFQPLLSAVVKVDGTAAAEKWLAGLQANGRIYPDNETVVNQVNNGESAIGPINSYYWYRLRDELGASSVHSALHYYADGDPGDLVDVSGAAMLRASSHRAAAQRFLAFLVSQAGQETIAHSHSYEYPLRPGVSAAAGVPPLAGLHPVALTPGELGDGSAALALEQKLGLL